MTGPGPRYDAAKVNRARIAEVARLRALLQRLEWAGGDDWGAACPECQAYRDPTRQHDPGCELAAELARGARGARVTIS